jgi:hypothetical protein
MCLVRNPNIHGIPSSIPGVVPFPVLLPPGDPVLPDQLEVFGKVRMEPEQWRKTGAGGPLPAFPTPGISSLLCTGPDDASLFAPTLPAREAAFQPDYRLQDLRKGRILAERGVPPGRDQGILIEAAFFQFGVQNPDRGKERTAGRDTIGTA